MAAAALLLLGLVLTGVSSELTGRDYRHASFDLVRLLTEKPWLNRGHWKRLPREPILISTGRDIQHENDYNNQDIFRSSSEKRSAVATALNTGRRRRQPSPALGKAVTPYIGVGVLNDMGIFFDSLRDNLETLASLSPEERSTFFHEPPTVVLAPSSSSGGGGGVKGIGKLHALRPLRPSGNIRSYNRRSFLEADGAYPGAYNHDPELLWTGLGR